MKNPNCPQCGKTMDTFADDYYCSKCRKLYSKDGREISSPSSSSKETSPFIPPPAEEFSFDQSEEPVLKIENGLSETIINGKKLWLKSPLGSLILTNKRLIFAPKYHGNLKAIPGVFAPYFTQQRVIGKLTSLELNELYTEMQQQGSLQIPLVSIIDARHYRPRVLGSGTPRLLLTWTDEAGNECSATLVKNGVTTVGFQDWEAAIKAQQAACLKA